MVHGSVSRPRQLSSLSFSARLSSVPWVVFGWNSSWRIPKPWKEQRQSKQQETLSSWLAMKSANWPTLCLCIHLCTWGASRFGDKGIWRRGSRGWPQAEDSYLGMAGTALPLHCDYRAPRACDHKLHCAMYTFTHGCPSDCKSVSRMSS